MIIKIKIKIVTLKLFIFKIISNHATNSISGIYWTPNKTLLPEFIHKLTDMLTLCKINDHLVFLADLNIDLLNPNNHK